MRKIVVTIDGPAGAGKTTVSRLLAERLGYRYVDTGALYRAVALAALSAGVAPDDDAGLKMLCAGLRLRFTQTAEGTRLFCNDADVTAGLRTPEITMLASAVSARPVVRRFLLGVQRAMAREKGAVFEGRDMGTVVFPDAEVKFYLDAPEKIRAMRRYLELKPATQVSIEQVERDLQRRDRNDSTRKAAPLKVAADAIRIDSTDLTAEEVVTVMQDRVDRLADA
jgi:cytidylate kinase